MNVPEIRPLGHIALGSVSVRLGLGIPDYHPIQYYTPIYQRLSARERSS